MRTTVITKPADVTRKWYLVDAEGHTLGRLASEVAKILRGKHKPIFAPNVDTGDYVIIVNADKINVTGKKLDQKVYRHHSNHPGGLKEVTLRTMLSKKPEEVFIHAVRGMLPKNVIGRKMLRKMKVYAGPTHKNDAQQPEVLNIVE